MKTLELAQIKNHLFHGDCEQVLEQFPSSCIDLIMTSPPYAQRRKKTYGGIHPDQYVAWFLPKSKEFMRVLKDTGSFILNIKENVINGQRHTYVLDLIVQLQKQGWLRTEEYIWHKKNSHPGKRPNRFRDGWERLLHFTKKKQFKMRQEAVMIPASASTLKNLRRTSATPNIRKYSKTGSGFETGIHSQPKEGKIYPDNVLHLPTSCKRKCHSAMYPDKLPERFIQLFTDPGDIVLDPFVGSGTTAIVAKALQRHFVGVDLMEEYIALAKQELAEL